MINDQREREVVADASQMPQFASDQIGPHCLVTGGAGYLGKALIKRLLLAGCRVRSFDVVPHKHEEGVEIIVGDLCDYEAVRAACVGIDSVFHTAALINTLSYYRKAVYQKVFGVNVGGTKNILRAAKEAGVQTLVHTSSFNVSLSPEGKGAMQTEAQSYAFNGRDLYTMSKIAAEQEALAADTAAGLRVCALRPGGIWGSDTESLMIRGFLEQLAAGKFGVLVGKPSAKTDNTHIDNLVDAQLLAMSKLRMNPTVAGGQAYNITDGEPMNGMLWFRPLVEGCGYPFPSRWLPMALMRLVGRISEWAHFMGAPQPLITVRAVNNLAESSCLSIEKARNDLGYVPRYNAANGMKILLPLAQKFVEQQAQKGRK